MKNKITRIVVDLSAWSEHYPTGCVLYHHSDIVDDEYCDNADEFIEFIESHKADIIPGITDVQFVFDGFDIDNETALDCAKEVWEYAYKLIHRQ